MVNDYRFKDALKTTLFLMALILHPVLPGDVMALILQAQLKGNTIFLYIYAIPLGCRTCGRAGVGDHFHPKRLFEYLLQKLGVVDRPYVFSLPIIKTG